MKADLLAPVVAAHAAEYSAIRDEICAFHNVEGQIMAITVTMIGVLAAWLAGGGHYQAYLHVIPIPFVALGIIFAYTQARIVQSATYLHRELRDRVVGVLTEAGDEQGRVWNWEIFRRSNRCPIRILANWLNAARWLFFILPALFPLTAWKREFHTVGDVLLLVFDLLLPAVLIVVAIWSSTLLPGRVVVEG
ncbi:MAG TPA: hypothetical protein VGM07_00305 [Stellaceae bacterium]